LAFFYEKSLRISAFLFFSFVNWDFIAIFAPNKKRWQKEYLGARTCPTVTPHFASLIRVVKENAVPIIH